MEFYYTCVFLFYASIVKHVTFYFRALAPKKGGNKKGVTFPPLLFYLQLIYFFYFALTNTGFTSA